MDIYLPIAGQSVNALLMILLGFIVGVLSGMFGVGGGFLTTPLLIFYGIPPTVAVASATTQITGASVSGVMVHTRKGGVDLKMAGIMIVGGVFGSIVGAALFRLLQASGQIDVVIGLLYVLILFSIGGLMLKDALVALGWMAPTETAAPPRHNKWVASLPGRWRFYASGLYISPLAPLALGFIAGILTVLLGVGGGFILVPAMIYLLGMAARVVIGTSLVMTFLFHGWGLGLYARYGRLELLPFVVLGWALMLAWSKPWLAHFRYGPLEWLWRSLTYGSLASFRR